MTDIVDKNSFDTVPLIEVGDTVKGGLTGAANKQAIALANRTLSLKLRLDGLPATADQKGTAEGLMVSHLQDADPHPIYLKPAAADQRYLQLSGSNVPGGWAKLDSNGKIPSSLLDMIQSSYVVVADQTARLALPKTDNLTIAAQADIDTLFYLNGKLDPSVSSNWVQGQAATVSGVSRVFGRTGDVKPQAGDYTADQITETSTRTFVTPQQKTDWTAKQEKLVSGSTIKTFKGTNLLGAGDFNPTPADLGCAPTSHQHVPADMPTLQRYIQEAIGGNLISGGGIGISFDSGTGKTTLAGGGGSGGGGLNLIVATRLNAIAGQLHNIDMGSLTDYNLIAYALKKEAGATGQINPVGIFTADNKANFSTTDAVLFNNTLKAYHGETFTTQAKDAFYAYPILTNGAVNISEVTGASVIPVMSANNLPSGYVASASNTTTANFSPWYAFDGKQGSTNDGADCWAGFWSGMSDTNPVWLRIDTPVLSRLGSYNVVNRANNENAPTSWKLQGSNDGGSTWTTLHTVTGAPNWASGEERSYTIPAPYVGYKSYRIAITAVQNTNRNWVGIAELKLFAAPAKFLLRQGSKYYTVASGALQAVTGTVDGSVVDAQGVSSINNLTFNQGSMELVVNDVRTYKYTYLPGSQIAIPKALTLGSRWESVQSATLNKTETGSGQVRVAITLDLTNYWVFTNGAWTNIGTLTADTAGGDKLNAQGMNATTLAAITAAQWKLLFTGQAVNDFAFAYGLKLASATADEAIVSSFLFTVNNIASWKTQTSAEVEMRWYSNGVTFKTITAGDYKLVYQLP